jgi:hypothetical protein
VDLYGDSLQIIVPTDYLDAEEAVRAALTDAGLEAGSIGPAPMNMEVAFARVMAEVDGSLYEGGEITIGLESRPEA